MLVRVQLLLVSRMIVRVFALPVVPFFLVFVRMGVRVFVLVLDRQVAMRVLVAGPQREGDPGRRHRHRDDLHDRD